jgi:hypothetical protein
VTVSLTEVLAERAGPMVVKELRQGLRARVFGVVFGVLLLACLLVALVAYGQALGAVGEALGPRFVTSYLVALGMVTFFVIPFSAFRSMMRELEGETWSLLVLTGLDARAILGGKWLTAMSQAVLFGSACAPFVLFSYYLNGVDLLRLVTSLGACAVWSALLTAMAIGLATQSRGRLARSSSNVSIIGVLLMAMWAGDGVLAAMINSDFLVARVVVGLGPALVLCLGTTVLVLEGAAAGMALTTEQTRARPRRALLLTVLATLGAGSWLFVRVHGREEGAALGAVALCFYLVLAGFFAISEHDGFPPHARGGWLTRPGAFRSFSLVAALLVLVALTCLFCVQLVHGDDRASRVVIAAAAYPLLYLSLGAIAGRMEVLERFGQPLATRGAFAVLTAVGIVVPPLASFVTGGQVNAVNPNTFNPFMGLVNYLDRRSDELNANLAVLLAFTALAGLGALVVLGRRDGARR